LSTTSGATTTSTAASTITYTVTGTGPCANPVQDSVTVNVLTASALNINAGADGTVCVGEPISLNATTTGGFAGNVYDWTVFSGYLADSVINSNSLNASVMATHEGLNMYEITVIDLCGNMASDTVVYDVTNDCELTIPNIFTPNGDGNNDMFYVNGNGIVTYSLSIFDRWGKKVFETSDIAKGWDGGGNSDGTYYYILRAEMRNSKEVDKQGYIQLLSN
jgi:gliding motility-associated-like protein